MAAPVPTSLLVVFVTLAALTLALLAKSRGKRQVKVIRKATTQLKIQLKIALPEGASTGFPTLRAISKTDIACTLDRVDLKVSRNDGREPSAAVTPPPGTKIEPEPGIEVNLSEAFQKVAQELCETQDAGTPVKINLSIQCGFAGMSIPVSATTLSGRLSYDRLEDFHQE